MRARTIKSEDLLFGKSLESILSDERETKKLYENCVRLAVKVECYYEWNDEPEYLIVELVPFEDTGEYRILTTDKELEHMLEAKKIVMGDNVLKLGAVYALKSFPHSVLCSVEATKKQKESV